MLRLNKAKLLEKNLVISYADVVNLVQLRALVATEETGSITQAAERIGLTQSGASQAVAALEEYLGVRLVVRGRRGASLTAIGQDIAEHARDALDHLDAIRQRADAARGLERGRLRLASFPSVIPTLLGPLLKKFRLRHPGIEVIALEATDGEVDVLIATGAIDIGVVMDPEPGPDAAMLGEDEWVAVVPMAHRFARRSGGVVSFTELVIEPFVLATGGCRTHARSLARAANLDLAEVKIEVRDWSSAFAFVREGMGISLVPRLTLPESRRGLKILPLAEPIYRKIGLKIAASSANALLARAFLALASSSQMIISKNR